MCARQFWYGVTPDGTARQVRSRLAGMNRHDVAPLNPRVRGSSPWRRTRAEQAV
jgi:hypothetical protein